MGVGEGVVLGLQLGRELMYCTVTQSVLPVVQLVQLGREAADLGAVMGGLL